MWHVDLSDHFKNCTFGVVRVLLGSFGKTPKTGVEEYQGTHSMDTYWWDTCWWDTYWWDTYWWDTYCKTCWRKRFEWIRIAWIRTGGIRVERIRIGGIRIGGIRFEWICVGYVWCDGYVWDMCGVRYVWDMCGVRYANNLLKNPATKRLSGKMGRKETIHLFKARLFYLGDSCVAHPPTTTLSHPKHLSCEFKGPTPRESPRNSLPCYMGYEKQPWTLNNPWIPQ